MIQHGNLAGEWIIGGVEAKGFAFVLIFLALEALACDRWNRAWLLLGAASAFHVVVGGWATLAAAIAWALARWDGSARGFASIVPPLRETASREKAVPPPLRAMWPGLTGGLILSLPGLVPALLLNAGTAAAAIREANMIYVYERLPHHLDLWRFPLSRLVPFAVLCLLWLVLGIVVPDRLAVRRIRSFAVASLAITLLGMFLSFLTFWNPSVAAGLLRFYWFRLSDVALPLGIALLAAAGIVVLRQSRPKLGWLLTGFVVVLAGLHVGDCAVLRLFSAPPHYNRSWDLDAWTAACRWLASPKRTPIPVCQPRGDRLDDYPGWLDVCAWASRPEHIAPGAVFLTPRMSMSFKWYTGRGEAGTWKEVPQDARGIVEWRRRMDEFWSTHGLVPGQRWFESPAELDAARLRELAAKEQIDYILAPAVPPLALTVAYRNDSYIIYRVRPREVKGSHAQR